MRHCRLALAAVLLGNTLVAGCYAERPLPPTFRFSCASSSDCDAGRSEECIAGLCQVPCSVATYRDDCAEGNYAACFNGVCSSVCDVDANVCPGEQTCIGFEGIELPSGGGLFGSSSSTDVTLGFCGVTCTEGSCPDGEVCILGACAQSCDPAGPDTCDDGFVCFEGACIPDFGDSTGGSTTDASTTSESTTTDPSTTTDGGSDTDATSAGTGGMQ